MGIFDIFTGAPAKEAAERSRALFQQTQANLTSNTNAARDQAADYLRAGYRGAADQYGLGYDAATGAVRTGADNALGYLDTGARAAIQQITGARSDIAGSDAYKPVSDLAARFGAGSQLYADALGLNGADGNARAVSAFQTAPGYQFTLDTGLDAINRRRNSAGMLASGNADADAIRLATGLADQSYQQWLTSLQPYNGLEASATSTAAAGNAAQAKSLADLGVTAANIFNTSGQAKANVATGQGTSLADLASRYYGALAGLDTSEGTALAANTTNANNTINSIGLNLTPQIAGTYKDEANAALAGSGNLWNLGMNLAKLGAGAVGGMGGLSSLFGSGGGTSGYEFRQGFASPTQRA